MRILVVQESDWLEKGPHQSHHLMERMSERGHEILVIDYEILWRRHDRERTYSPRQVFPEVRKATESGYVTVVRPSALKLPVLEYLSLLYAHGKEIDRQINEFNPDLVVCFGILNAALAIKHAAIEKKPSVYYVIDELHRLVPQPWFRSLARRVEIHNMRRADLVMSINEGLRDYTIQMGTDREKTAVLRAGVDLQRFDAISSADRELARRKLGFDENDVVLFFMGWLYDFSGIREITLDMAKDEWRNSPLKLLIVGSGDSWTEINRVIKEKGLQENVVAVGWKPYAEIPALVMASDICILPALKNRIMMNIVPIKIYEYMAARKPVIATSLPGLMKEFGTTNGVSYINRPEEALSVALELSTDRRMADEGRKARMFVEKSDWIKMTETFEVLLQNLSKRDHTVG